MKPIYKRIILTVVTLVAIALSLFIYMKPGDIAFSNSGKQPPSHQIWDELLNEHVGELGSVNYKGFIADSIKLNEYLEILRENPPDIEIWSENERKAYWINVYNAHTVQLIVRYYPIASIKDIGSDIQIPFVNTPWDIKFISIDSLNMDLNDVEHSILRREFNDPRIHFAINCASESCPKLRNEAYAAEKLHEQLEEQTRIFMNDSTKNIIGENNLQLSRLFLWFKGDFTKNQSLIEYLQPYSEIEISNTASISHLEYDWSLNE